MTALTLKPGKRNRVRETRKDRIFNACNILFWILILFIVLYPLWLILIASVSDPDAVLQAKVLLWPVDFSLMGYETVLQNTELLGSYLNSVFYTVVGSALSVIISLAAAYALSVVVIGPSGSGKSTFLRCLNQLEEATSGKIFIDGKDLTDPGTDINKLRERVGMVFPVRVLSRKEAPVPPGIHTVL